MEAFDDSIGSTAESAQLESTPNESGNASKASDGQSQADIPELLQNNAPSGYKYCLTLVPRETDTLEKVLKNRVLSTKKVNPTTGGEASKPTRRKISMHGTVITTAEYIRRKLLRHKRNQKLKQRTKERILKLHKRNHKRSKENL